MAAYAIRVASVDDLAELLWLQSECQQVVAWSENLWRHLLADNTDAALRRVWVAETGGAVAGFLVQGGLREIAELEMVIVAAERRGMGLGKALCLEAMQWAKGQYAESMELEVRVSNGVALRLYESLGFARQGVRKDYYREPVEDAVLMSATL